MARIGIEGIYRITMCNIKEINMTRFLNNSLALAIAALLTLSSIGAIVTVPPAQAAGPAAFALAEIA